MEHQISVLWQRENDKVTQSVWKWKNKGLHWLAFFKLFQIPRRRARYSDSFFPAEYEYLKHFSQHVQIIQNFMLKI